MNLQNPSCVNRCTSCILTPAAAWKLWHQLVDLSDRLWDAYEQEFLEFSIQESEKEDSGPLPPSE
jgi:hypothetical protein